MLQCKFKAGTFWVFKDSVTNNIDTLMVLSLMQQNPSLPFGFFNGCGVETFLVKAVFKNDTGRVLISLRFFLQEKGFILDSDFFWTLGAQPLPYIYANFRAEPSFKFWDSLFINGSYHKNVGESYAVQFTTVEKFNNPSRMYSQSLKSYFNPEVGFLQFDLRDRLTGKLTGRRKIIERNIVR